MRTKFDVGATVYIFDPNAEEIVSTQVEMIFINEDGVFYKVGQVSLPEDKLFSCELQCKLHYKNIFS